MINGRGGRYVTLGAGVALLLVILTRAALLVAKQPEAAGSLDTIIALLTGAVMGALGVSPQSPPEPPHVTVTPPAPHITVQPTVTPPAQIVVQPAENTAHPPWKFDPVTGEPL